MPGQTDLKSVTPGSVKALMVIEAVVIAFFAFWLANEYYYNVYFRTYADSIFIQNVTSYTIAIGVGIGLAGTALAATFYKMMREARVKLDTVAPRIKGSVEKLVASVPAIEAKTTVKTSGARTTAQIEPTQPATMAPNPIVAATKAPEEKK